MSPRASLVMGVSVGAGKQDSGQLGLHLGVSQFSSPFLGHNDYVPRRQFFFVASEKLPQQPFDPVALEGLARLAPRHQSQPGAWALSWGQADTEMRCIQFFSPGLGPEILPATAKPFLPGKAGRPEGCRGATGNDSLAGGLEGMLQRCSLYLTPRGASGPWPGDAAKSGGPPWCACAPGSRGCGPGAVYSVEKFASCLFFLETILITNFL
jgi:hypothetical protein